MELIGQISKSLNASNQEAQLAETIRMALDQGLEN